MNEPPVNGVTFDIPGDDDRRGFSSLDTLTQAITQSFTAPQQGPPRRLIDVGRDYREMSLLLTAATGEADRVFYTSVLAGLSAELQQLGTGAAGTSNSNDNGEAN